MKLGLDDGLDDGTMRKYIVVIVDPHELTVESGKTLPYSTYIGAIRKTDGKIDVWTPAAPVPRGYPAAARAMLEKARAQLRTEGKIPPDGFKTRAQNKRRYNRRGWLLCECVKCGRHHYVEPHGTTAECECSKEWTEHRALAQYND